MANYESTFRTNYFRVKDAKEFEEFMGHVQAEDLQIFKLPDATEPGKNLYGFGGYGNISGIIGLGPEPYGSLYCIGENGIKTKTDFDSRDSLSEAITSTDGDKIGYVVIYQEVDVHFAIANGLKVNPNDIPCYVEEYCDEDEEPDYDAFINGLKEHVVDGDAIILMEVGNEKLRYVTGYATIITSKNVSFVDLTQLALETAREELGIQKWQTRMEY